MITAYWGEHEKYLPAWFEAAVATGADVIARKATPVEMAHPYTQALALNRVMLDVKTKWAQFVGVDDILYPDAHEGVLDIPADLISVGYDTSDGYTYLPVLPTYAENKIAGSSIFRTQMFHKVGGFPVIGFEDWGLWRRMGRAGARLYISQRAHYWYRQHPDQRTRHDIFTQRSLYYVELRKDGEPRPRE